MVLLAKPNESLYDHTMNTLRILLALKCNRQLYRDIAGIDVYELAALALAMHDIGKAAVGFQKYITHIRTRDQRRLSALQMNPMINLDEASQKYEKAKRWGYRHEILSAGIMMSLDFKDQIDSERHVALAILSHHKDFDTLWKKYATCPRNNAGFLNYERRVKELKPNLREIIRFIQRLASELEPKFSYASQILNTIPIEPDTIINNMLHHDDPFTRYIVWFRELEDTDIAKARNLYFLIKGIVTLCDHLASGGIRVLKYLTADSTYSRFAPNSAQLWASKLNGSGILVAPTGSGKTEAALLWAKKNLSPCRRILYVLPTTASINRMYLRLRDQFSEGKASNYDIVSMLHHRSSFFLYSYYSDEQYLMKGISPKKLNDLAHKIYSPIKVTTPFQPLKTLFGVKGYERGFLELSGSLVIVDEIHAYNPHVIALILFLLAEIRKIKSKIFIMSATMPKFLIELLQNYAGISSENILIDTLLDNRTRHIVHLLHGEIISSIDMIAKVSCKNRTLVVCNTVRTAVMVYNILRTQYTIGKIILLHGRFTLRDRIRHEHLIDEANVLVATQAIEVSLDIDFDVAFTEPAPIDALLQRFGRVNRRGRIFGGAPVYVFEQGGQWDSRIYKNYIRVSDTIEALRKRSLNGEIPITERLARELVDEVYKSGFSEEEDVLFESAYQSLQAYWNDIVPFEKGRSDNFYRLFESIEVIPSVYEDEIESLIDKGEGWRIAEYLVPIPLRVYALLKRANLVRRESPYPICDIPYDSDLGFRTDQLSQLAKEDVASFVY